MRRVLSNILLLLLLFFVVPVYLVNPRLEVLVLGVLLLAVGTFLAYGNQARGLETLGLVTFALSFVGAAFWGQYFGQNTGGFCGVSLWIFLLVIAAIVLYRRAVFVERGQILVLNQLPENRALVWTEGLHRPLRPFVERRMAALPAYELELEAIINQINTKSLYDVRYVKILVRYRVAQPRDVVFNFPNREQAYEELARDRQPPDDNDTDEQVAFWTELIRRQMLIEIDQAVRTIIASVQGPTDVSTDRATHAELIGKRLHASIKRWGMEVLELRVLEVVIDPDRIKMAFRDRIIARERADAERKSELRADEVRKLGEAQAEATANMVSAMVRTLQQQGTSLSKEDIESIVITALQRASDQQQLSGFFRDFAAPPVASSATGATQPLDPNAPRP